MSERKNLDKLFQDKFKNLEVAPPESAWQNISSKLYMWHFFTAGVMFNFFFQNHTCSRQI